MPRTQVVYGHRQMAEMVFDEMMARCVTAPTGDQQILQGVEDPNRSGGALAVAQGVLALDKSQPPSGQAFPVHPDAIDRIISLDVLGEMAELFHRLGMEKIAPNFMRFEIVKLNHRFEFDLYILSSTRLVLALQRRTQVAR